MHSDNSQCCESNWSKHKPSADTNQVAKQGVWWQHKLSSNTRLEVASVLWWQVLEQQRPALEKQLVELAVTGAAFTHLQQSEAMEQLLFYTRIFARFAPEQKVRT